MKRLFSLFLIISLLGIIATGYGGLCHKKDKNTDTGSSTPAPVEEPDTGSSGPPAKTCSADPADGAVNVPLDKWISWAPSGQGTTYEADSYNIYFGTTNPPLDDLPIEFIVNITATTHNVTPLTAGAVTHYWRTDSKNDKGVTKGNVWHFTTVPLPPGPATAPNPANGATNVSTLAQLYWSAPTDPQAYAESYDVYSGDAANNLQFKANVVGISYNPGPLTYNTTYYWQVKSKNFTGTANGDIWSFHTAPNGAPALASIGSKVTYEDSILTFVISATDPQNDVLTYSATGLPTGATFTASTRTFAWTPSFTQAN
ncbi:MAG: hypothetical protein HY762_07205, partial [Planctomycetes bacterium]|nr:hypothetical protein [Planctomycetota bacterium]